MKKKQKTCSCCKLTKSYNEFPYKSQKKQCKQCLNNKQNERRRKRTQWLEEFKKSLKCQICQNDDFRVLEFDHLNDKVFNVGDAACFGLSVETIKNEIKKCQVLCANCHRIKTYEERKFKSIQE
jgi:hypothetical protein